ncbi:MAG: hypothetical protein ACTJLL_02555 [Anaplasma sp.]
MSEKKASEQQVRDFVLKWKKMYEELNPNLYLADESVDDIVRQWTGNLTEQQLADDGKGVPENFVLDLLKEGKERPKGESQQQDGSGAAVPDTQQERQTRRKATKKSDTLWTKDWKLRNAGKIEKLLASGEGKAVFDDLDGEEGVGTQLILGMADALMQHFDDDADVKIFGDVAARQTSLPGNVYEVEKEATVEVGNCGQFDISIKYKVAKIAQQGSEQHALRDVELCVTPPHEGAHDGYSTKLCIGREIKGNYPHVWNDVLPRANDQQIRDMIVTTRDNCMKAHKAGEWSCDDEAVDKLVTHFRGKLSVEQTQNAPREVYDAVLAAGKKLTLSGAANTKQMTSQHESTQGGVADDSPTARTGRQVHWWDDDLNLDEDKVHDVPQQSPAQSAKPSSNVSAAQEDELLRAELSNLAQRSVLAGFMQSCAMNGRSSGMAVDSYDRVCRDFMEHILPAGAKKPTTTFPRLQVLKLLQGMAAGSQDDGANVDDVLLGAVVGTCEWDPRVLEKQLPSDDKLKLKIQKQGLRLNLGQEDEYGNVSSLIRERHFLLEPVVAEQNIVSRLHVVVTSDLKLERDGLGEAKVTVQNSKADIALVSSRLEMEDCVKNWAQSEGPEYIRVTYVPSGKTSKRDQAAVELWKPQGLIIGSGTDTVIESDAISEDKVCELVKTGLHMFVGAKGMGALLGVPAAQTYSSRNIGDYINASGGSSLPIKESLKTLSGKWLPELRDGQNSALVDFLGKFLSMKRCGVTRRSVAYQPVPYGNAAGRAKMDAGIRVSYIYSLYLVGQDQLVLGEDAEGLQVDLCVVYDILEGKDDRGRTEHGICNVQMGVQCQWISDVLGESRSQTYNTPCAESIEMWPCPAIHCGFDYDRQVTLEAQPAKELGLSAGAEIPQSIFDDILRTGQLAAQAANKSKSSKGWFKTKTSSVEQQKASVVTDSQQDEDAKVVPDDALNRMISLRIKTLQKDLDDIKSDIKLSSKNADISRVVKQLSGKYTFADVNSEEVSDHIDGVIISTCGATTKKQKPTTDAHKAASGTQQSPASAVEQDNSKKMSDEELRGQILNTITRLRKICGDQRQFDDDPEKVALVVKELSGKYTLADMSNVDIVDHVSDEIMRVCEVKGKEKEQASPQQAPASVAEKVPDESSSPAVEQLVSIKKPTYDPMRFMGIQRDALLKSLETLVAQAWSLKAGADEEEVVHPKLQGMTEVWNERSVMKGTLGEDEREVHCLFDIKDNNQDKKIHVLAQVRRSTAADENLYDVTWLGSRVVDSSFDVGQFVEDNESRDNTAKKYGFSLCYKEASDVDKAPLQMRSALLNEQLNVKTSLSSGKFSFNSEGVPQTQATDEQIRLVIQEVSESHSKTYPKAHFCMDAAKENKLVREFSGKLTIGQLAPGSVPTYIIDRIWEEGRVLASDKQIRQLIERIYEALKKDVIGVDAWRLENSDIDGLILKYRGKLHADETVAGAEPAAIKQEVSSICSLNLKKQQEQQKKVQEDATQLSESGSGISEGQIKREIWRVLEELRKNRTELQGWNPDDAIITTIDSIATELKKKGLGSDLKSMQQDIENLLMQKIPQKKDLASQGTGKAAAQKIPQSKQDTKGVDAQQSAQSGGAQTSFATDDQIRKMVKNIADRHKQNNPHEKFDISGKLEDEIVAYYSGDLLAHQVLTVPFEVRLKIITAGREGALVAKKRTKQFDPEKLYSELTSKAVAGINDIATRNGADSLSSVAKLSRSSDMGDGEKIISGDGLVQVVKQLADGLEDKFGDKDTGKTLSEQDRAGMVSALEGKLYVDDFVDNDSYPQQRTFVEIVENVLPFAKKIAVQEEGESGDDFDKRVGTQIGECTIPLYGLVKPDEAVKAPAESAPGESPQEEVGSQETDDSEKLMKALIGVVDLCFLQVNKECNFGLTYDAEKVHKIATEMAREFPDMDALQQEEGEKCAKRAVQLINRDWQLPEPVKAKLTGLQKPAESAPKATDLNPALWTTDRKLMATAKLTEFLKDSKLWGRDLFSTGATVRSLDMRHIMTVAKVVVGGSNVPGGAAISVVSKEGISTVVDKLAGDSGYSVHRSAVVGIEDHGQFKLEVGYKIGLEKKAVNPRCVISDMMISVGNVGGTRRTSTTLRSTVPYYHTAGGQALAWIGAVNDFKQQEAAQKSGEKEGEAIVAPKQRVVTPKKGDIGAIEPGIKQKKGGGAVLGFFARMTKIVITIVLYAFLVLWKVISAPVRMLMGSNQKGLEHNGKGEKVAQWQQSQPQERKVTILGRPSRPMKPIPVAGGDDQPAHKLKDPIIISGAPTLGADGASQSK